MFWRRGPAGYHHDTSPPRDQPQPQDSAEKLELELLPELVVCAGFFLIYLVEEVAGLVVGGREEVRRDSESECSLREMERRDVQGESG